MNEFLDSTSNSSDDTIPPASAIAAPTRPLSPAAPNNQGSRFKIAFSYRSETKDRVSAINDLVHNSLANSECRNPVFYAPNFDEQMAVIDARRILRHIYEEAQMVVVFLSPTYHGSPFTYHEWRTVRNRFMGSAIRNEDKRLLLIKLDEFNARELDLFDDDFFLDAVNFSSEQIADRILQRWNSVS